GSARFSAFSSTDPGGPPEAAHSPGRTRTPRFFHRSILVCEPNRRNSERHADGWALHGQHRGPVSLGCLSCAGWARARTKASALGAPHLSHLLGAHARR